MRKYGVRYGFIVFCAGICLSGMMIPQLFGQLDRGIELLNSGDYSKAENVLSETLKADPRNATVRYYLGMALLLEDKNDQALKEFQTVQTEHAKAGKPSGAGEPNGSEIRLALARAYMGLKQYGEAWKHLESARTENAGSSEVFMYRGIYYFQQKKYTEAIADLEKSVKLDPKNAYAYYHLGNAYSETDQPAKMVEVFKIFLQLAPNAPEAPKVQKRVAAAC